MIKSLTYRLQIMVDDNGPGSFSVLSGQTTLAVITVRICAGQITVYRVRMFTRVGVKRIARILFEEIVSYARAHALKVVTIAGYVRNQFSKRPLQYADLWEKN